jgi:hypothetical protein
MDFVRDESTIKIDEIKVDKETIDMLEAYELRACFANGFFNFFVFVFVFKNKNRKSFSIFYFFLLIKCLANYFRKQFLKMTEISYKLVYRKFLTTYI